MHSLYYTLSIACCGCTNFLPELRKQGFLLFFECQCILIFVSKYEFSRLVVVKRKSISLYLFERKKKKQNFCDANDDL